MSEQTQAIGIDTYHGDNRPVDWRRVMAAGISFVCLKASEGTTGTDSAFVADWQALGELGLSRGAYHFLKASQDSAAQAAHFLAVLEAAGGLQPNDLPPVIDIEIADGMEKPHIVACVRHFANAVKAATGRTCMLYTSPGFAEQYLDDSLGDLPLWIAHYTSKPAPTIPAGWNEWTIWQYAAGEGAGGPAALHPDGCPSPVDSNRAFGTHEELLERLGITGKAASNV